MVSIELVTKEEFETSLSNKSEKGHKHTIADITDLPEMSQYATKADLNMKADEQALLDALTKIDNLTTEIGLLKQEIEGLKSSNPDEPV